MGGWIVFFGDIPDLQNRLRRFERIFAVSTVPPLNTEIHKLNNNLTVVGWAWRNRGVPDLNVVTSADGDALVLCGVLTGMGWFGDLEENQEATARKLLDLWLLHGDASMQTLNGSFSCVFYHAKERQLTLYTDRFASRSIWQIAENKSWIVGNFPSAIAAVMLSTPKLDPVGLWSLFSLGRRIGTYGIYAGIKPLIAGQKAIFTAGADSPRSARWWERRYTPNPDLTARRWGLVLAEALRKSADRYRSVSSSPYLFLSGGLDSRIAAAVLGKPLKTISLCTTPNVETSMAARVANVLDLDHRVIQRTPYWYLDTVDAAALISSGDHLSKHAHFIVPVGDISAGDPAAAFYLGDLMENFSKHYFEPQGTVPLDRGPSELSNFLITHTPWAIADVSRVGSHFNPYIRRALEERYFAAVEDVVQSVMSVSEDSADRLDTMLRWIDVSVTYTHNMLTCMWPLAPERNLYCDNAVDDLSLHIPAPTKGAGRLHTWILWHLNKRLTFIPDVNYLFPPLAPQLCKTIIKKLRKQLGVTGHARIRRVIKSASGSWPHMYELYRHDERYRGYVETLLSNQVFFPEDVFDMQRIHLIWDEFLSGNTRLQYDIEALVTWGTLQKLIPSDGIAL